MSPIARISAQVPSGDVRVTIHASTRGGPASGVVLRSGRVGATTDAAGSATPLPAPATVVISARRIGLAPDSVGLTLRASADTTVALMLREQAAVSTLYDTRTTPSLFAQHTDVSSNGLTTQLNGRCDLSSRYGTICTPRASLMARAGDAFTTRLSAAGGWDAPTGRSLVYLNLENLTNVRQTNFDPLLRAAPGAGGRRTVDEWAPLEGRSANAGLSVRL